MTSVLCGLPPKDSGLARVDQVIFRGSIKECHEERKFRELLGWQHLRVVLA